MAFWVNALLFIGSAILNRIFQPKVNYARQAAAPEAFQTITAEAGRAIPVLWGTRQIKNSNIGWFGDLSNTAIVQSGVTTGYHYYMGGQYIVCLGPIDAVTDLRWNEKQVGSGVSVANNQVVFGTGTPWTNIATIPEGNYSTGEQLALAVETAMKAAVSAKWKVTFGFTIVAGRNDELCYSVTYNGVTYVRKATIAAGAYTLTVSIKAAIAGALNAAETAATGDPTETRGSFACDYGVHAADSFSITYTPGAGSYDSFQILGEGDATFDYLKSAKSTIGFRLDQSQQAVGDPKRLVAAYATFVTRFVFAFVGTGAKLKLTHASFTAAGLLGLSTAADVDLLAKTSDTDFTIIEATYTETTDYVQVDIDDADFFGTEGGVVGRLDVYRGLRTQAGSGYLDTEWAATAPGFRGTCYMVQRGMLVGDTNFPKPISITPRRCPNQLALTGEMHNIAGDANPAAMIWEILTDPYWGLGMAEDELDRDSFVEVAQTLYAEDLGLSMLDDALGPAQDVIDEILRHVDGVRRMNPVTGLFGIKLIRNDYDLGSLPVASSELGNVTRCTLRRRSWGELKNAVKIRYVDRDADFRERTVTKQDLAGIQARGGEMAIEEYSFPGISRASNANVVAARLLRAVSWPAAEFELEVNREFWSLRQGDVFLLTWLPLGITAMPCRVVNIRTGLITDGRIGIDAVEDLAGPAWTGFSAITAPANDAAAPLDITPGADASDSVLVGGVPMPEA